MSVAARVRRPRAPPFIDPPGYGRHRPEATLPCQLIGHHPAFREPRSLPKYVRDELEADLKVGIGHHGPDEIIQAIGGL